MVGDRPVPWLHLVLWLLVLLLLLAAWLVPPYVDDDARRRILASGTLRVGLDPAYPPFEYTDGEGRLVGYDVDLARALARELGLEVVLVPTAYDSLYDALLSGQIDVILSSYPYSPELCRRERCTRPYFQAGLVLIVRAGGTVAGPADLAGRIVGVEWGGPGEVWARLGEQAGRIGSHVVLMDPEETLQALLAGRVDGAVVDRVSALLFAASHEGLVILEPAVEDESFVAVVAAQSLWLHGQLERALERLERNGALRALESHWCGHGYP